MCIRDSFKLPDQQLMDVTHHRSHDQFQTYVVNASWRDPEAEAHAARTFSLWAQDLYKPPVTACMPDALGRMNETHESAFGSIKQAQTSINSVHDCSMFSAFSELILQELKNIRARDGEEG